MVACAYATARIMAGTYAAYLRRAVGRVLVFIGCACALRQAEHTRYGIDDACHVGLRGLPLQPLAALWRERMYILAGIATGLAASTFYNGAAVALIVAPAGLVLVVSIPYAAYARRLSIAVLAGDALVFRSWRLRISCATSVISGTTCHVSSSNTRCPGKFISFFVVDQWTGLRYLLSLHRSLLHRHTCCPA